MNDGEKKLVIKYYDQMKRAKEHSYIMSSPMSEVRELYDIYKREIKDDWTANLNCGSCLVRFFQKMYDVWYDKVQVQLGIEPKSEPIVKEKVTRVNKKVVADKEQKSSRRGRKQNISAKNNKAKKNR